MSQGLTPKRLLYLTESIREIESNGFDESSIRLLLIEIRDYLKKQSFLYEVCHFVAHPNRDRGICHKTINSRHAKIKFFEDEVSKYRANGFFDSNEFKNISEWEFSTKMLGYLEPRKVEKTLFEVLILDGIDDVPEEYFIEHFGESRRKLKLLIQKTYRKVGNYYVLPATIKGKKFEFIDELLKFIRGAFQGKAVISQGELEQQLVQGIKTVCSSKNIKFSTSAIRENLQDIVVCIMAILHEATFDLFDGSQAKAYLCLHKDDDANRKYNLFLYARADRLSFPVFSSKIRASKYIPAALEKLAQYDMNEIPYVKAIRNKNGELKLVKYDSL